MIDENQLRKMAAGAIRAGRIPARRALRSWGGSGTGLACSICAQPVNADEIEYELEFEESAAPSEVCRVHGHCLAAWECERRAFAATDS